MADNSSKDFDLSTFLKDIGKKNKFDFNLTDFSHDKGTKDNRADDLRTAIVQIHFDQSAAFKKLNVLQVFGAKLALTSLQLAVNSGYINPHQLLRIADFGAGSGGPTFALVEISKILNGEVVAIENNPKSVSEIVSYGILPQEQIRMEDGINYLNHVKQTEGLGFDLVTSYMLGPDLSGRMFRELASASSRALNEGGNLLITSDAGTFSVAKSISDRSGVPTTFFHQIGEGKNIIVPNTLIIPKRGLSNLR